MHRLRVCYKTNGETNMIEGTPMDKFIKQMTFSFMTEGKQMWFPWVEAIDPKPRRRNKLKKKNKKNES